jgi:hypothetical protein
MAISGDDLATAVYIRYYDGEPTGWPEVRCIKNLTARLATMASFRGEFAALHLAVPTRDMHHGCLPQQHRAATRIARGL